MRIVVIEDNEDVGQYLETFLQQEGHEPVLVPAEFQVVLHRDFWVDVDVALIDLLLGHALNGGHILAWLKANAPHVRRVVLSAVANHVDVKEQAHAVLVKPASPSAIRAALKGGVDGDRLP